MRDALRDIAAMAYKVIREPVVREADNATGVPALIADLDVKGVWQPKTEALFDILILMRSPQSSEMNPQKPQK